jgi:hypothetical protein
MIVHRCFTPSKSHSFPDELDKKLLLTIQSECNKQYIPLPWNAIGKTMGEHISGGAVIQHLAKLRTRESTDYTQGARY